MAEINGSTKVCGIFGYPVEHTFSPSMHNAAFKSCDLNFVYLPFTVKPKELERAVSGIRAMNITGVNITVPHKEKVIPFLDEVSEDARLIGAVNVIVNRGGRLCGYNTDGAGFVRALKEETGFLPPGSKILIMGAGGAARAVAVQLACSGAALITLANRTPARARKLADMLKNAGFCSEVLAYRYDYPDGGPELAEAVVVNNYDLVVQTTPVGMHPKERDCPSFPFQKLRPGAIICDIIYNPPRTVFLKRAGEAGAKTCNGLGMLLYQGVLAWEMWTGYRAPVEVMRKALLERLQDMVN